MDQNISQLSDDQLTELYRNPGIGKEIKLLIIKEIEERELQTVFVAPQKLEFREKLQIACTALISYKYHVRKSSELLLKGNRTEYKKYWRYFTIGIAFYIVLLLLAAKYIIKPLFTGM